MRFEDRNSWPQHRGLDQGRIRSGRGSRMNRSLDEERSFGQSDYMDEWDREEPRSSYYDRDIRRSDYRPDDYGQGDYSLAGDREGRRFDRPTQRRYGNRDYRGTEYSSADRYGENIGNSGFSDAGFYDDTSFDTNDQRFRRGEHYGKGPKGWRRSDDSIKDQACEALSDDSRLDASDIEVNVKDGVIHLKGTVDERSSKRRAESCVENLSGVQDVINEIRVHRESGNLRPREASESRTKQ